LLAASSSAAFLAAASSALHLSSAALALVHFEEVVAAQVATVALSSSHFFLAYSASNTPCSFSSSYLINSSHSVLFPAKSHLLSMAYCSI